MRRAETLWAEGTAARALFKPALGGWIVVGYGRPKRHADRRR
jgi:hypothetical protein